MQCNARLLVLFVVVVVGCIPGCGPQPGQPRAGNKAPAANSNAGKLPKQASNAPVSNASPAMQPHANESALVRARKAFRTRLVKKGEDFGPADKPPAEVFQLVKYPAGPGQLAAYVTPDPKDKKKHPAIVWITGGDCNSIGNVWEDDEPGNEQSAAAYRKAGLVMMFPSLRGGNDNPGAREGFLGEADDVVDAATYLASLPYVDPKRIYLGGHSTGGTLVLLVAASTDKFRAVFSFGPVADAIDYAGKYVYCSTSDSKEMALRAPVKWLGEIKSPTFVFEGGEEPSNDSSLTQLRAGNSNPLVKIYKVHEVDHFSVLGPVNRLIVKKVQADTGEKVRLAFTAQELASAVKE